MSLADTFENGPRGAPWTQRQLFFSVGLFLVGTVLLGFGALVATTGYFDPIVGDQIWRRWQLAGILGGFGLPLLTVGVIVLLPADRFEQAVAGVGIAFALAGIVMFYFAFPDQWVGDPTSYALPTVGLYFVGSLAMLYSILYSVAGFRQRNNPGGNVTLNFDEGSND